MPITASRLAVDVQATGVKETEGALAHLGGAVGKAGKPFGVANAAALAFKATLATTAGAAIVSGLKTASGLEQANIAFETMLGSGEQAKTFLDDLKGFAAETPFEFPDLVRASQRLLAMGFAAKDVRPTLTAIGDAVAGLGGGKEQINQVTTAIGQMMAKGKIQSDELLQLTEAGIPALKILADSYGVTTGQMQDMVSEGKVLSDKAIPALVKGLEHGTKSSKSFGGMMAKQSKTAAGMWSTLMDTFQMGMANVLTPLMPLLTTLLGGAIAGLTPLFQGAAAAVNLLISGGKAVIGWVRSLVDAFNGVGDALGSGGVTGWLAGFANQLNGLWQTVAPFVSQFVKGLQFAWDVLMSGEDVAYGLGETLDFALGNTGRFVGPIADAIGTAVTWLKRGWEVAKGFGQAVREFVTGPQMQGALAALRKSFADLGPKVIDALKGIWAAARKVFDALMDAKPLLLAVGAALALIIAPVPVLIAAFVALYAKVSWFRNLINGLVTFVVGTLLPALVNFAGWLISTWASAWATVAGVIAAVIPVISSTIGGAITWITGVIQAFLGWAVPVFSMAWQVIQANFALTWGLIKGIVQVAIGVIKAVINAGMVLIVTVVRGAMLVLGPIVKGAWTVIKGVIQGALQVIGGIIRTVLALLTGNWRQAWEGVKGIARGAWTAIKGIVQGGIQTMMGLIRNIPRMITNALSGLSGLLVGSGKALIQGLIRGIGSMGGSIKRYISGFISDHVPGFIKKMLGIGSPSKVMAREIGRWIPAGLVKGMASQTRAVSRAAGDMAKAALPTFPGLGKPSSGTSSTVTIPGKPKGPDNPGDLGFDPGRGPGGGGGVTFQFNTYNPVAEPQSRTTNKALDRVANVGLT